MLNVDSVDVCGCWMWTRWISVDIGCGYVGCRWMLDVDTVDVGGCGLGTCRLSVNVDTVDVDAVEVGMVDTD